MKKLIPALALVIVLGALLAACVAVPEPTEQLSRVAGGSLTAVSAAFGGGFGSTGCTITSAGNISCNGNAVIGGTTTLTGTLTLPGALNLTQTNAAGASANPFDWTGTAGIMNGTDDLTVLDLNLTNANHTSTGNTIQALDIAGITADAEATESAIKIGAGWDSDLNATTSLEMAIGGTSRAVLTDNSLDLTPATLGATTSQDVVEVIWANTAITTGTTIQSGLNLSLTNANHTGGTNSIYGLDIDGITQDASATETAINVDAGWDYGLDLDGNAVVIGADGGVTLDETSDDVLALTMGAGTGTFSVLTGNLKVGNGAPGVTQDGQDAYVTGTFEVDGATQLDGAVTTNSTFAADGGITVDTSNFTVSGSTGAVTSASTLAAAGVTSTAGASVSGGDITLATDATGGNAGAKSEFIGLPKIKLASLGAGTNGSTETTLYLPAADPAAVWVAISTTVTSSNDTDIRRVGVNSLKLAFGATAVDDNGAKIDITNDDLEANNESIGFWIRSDTALDAGDLDLLIDDDSVDTTLDICAVATVNVWQWCEVSIAALTGGNGDTVEQIGVVLKDAAGLGAFNVWLDGMYKWDETDEMELNVDIPYDGVLSVVSVVTAQDQPNTTVDLAEHTAYFVNYQTSSDVLVWITDQSASSAFALVAYQ